jgi:hypothetical protein
MADSIDIQPEFEEDRDPESSSSRLESQSDDISQSSRSRMPPPSRSNRKRSRIAETISDVVGTGDKAKEKQFREILLNVWREQKSQTIEHNSALREIAAAGKHHGPLAANIKKGLDVTSLKGFDELVQVAENNYPGFLQSFKGQSNEDKLMSAFRTGIKKTPRPWEDSIVNMAIGAAGEGFFEPAPPIQPPDSTDFNFGANVIGGGGSDKPPTDWGNMFGFGDDEFPEDDDFDPKSVGSKDDKERKRKIAAAQRLQARKDREQAARDRLQATRQNQDNNRKITEEGKSSLAASRTGITSAREQMTGIRSQATGARIGAYSLAASLGLKGYVAASLADRFLIQPAEAKSVQEQKDYIQKEKQYQQDLAAYQTRVKQAELERNRNIRDDISNRPVTAVALDDDGNPIHPAAYGSAVTKGNATGSGTSASTGGGPGGGGPPGVGPGTPSPSNPGKGKGGGIPPIIPGPAPIRPNAPVPGGGVGGAIAAATVIVPALAAAIEGAKLVNSFIDSTGKELASFSTSAIKGDGVGASKSLVNFSRKMSDPLGVNIPAQIAVTGFEALLDINQGILDSIKGTEAFAPQTLQASVEGDLAKFFQQIEMARRLDSVTAELVKANTQFELAWGELRAELIEAVAPVILTLLPLLTEYIKTMASNVSTLDTLIGIGVGRQSTQIDLIQKVVAWWMGITPDKIDAALERQLENFFSPTQAEKSLRQRRAFPN